MPKKAVVIGSGFSGLSAATALADKKIDVVLLEKNQDLGGRARSFKEKGFTFDMGPSWYWMPDVFDDYFQKYQKSVSDYYDLIRLDPSYKVFFAGNESVDIPADMDGLVKLFEEKERGAGDKLMKFLREAGVKYQLGMHEFVKKPGLSLSEFATTKVLSSVWKLSIFQSFHSYIRKYFKHPQLLQLLEFPVLFLGATPKDTPALYSLMNYADMKLGTWYPRGGMHKIIEGMVSLAEEKGVEIKTDAEVLKILVAQSNATSVETLNDSYTSDFVVGTADYHHIEKKLLDEEERNYPEEYWQKRTFSPSSLIFYLGVNKKLKNLRHHNLFFDQDFNLHAKELYDSPKWPSKPLFYVSCPSITDPSVAPDGHENLFILIPVASGLVDTDATREKYYDMVIERLEILTGQRIKKDVVFKRSYAHRDFIGDYNAYKGNAYGLANTLKQTAVFKPRMQNRNVKNLFYAGQLTVPGPGVPPSLISGQIAAEQILKTLN